MLLRETHAFVEVMRAGSFTAAAERLGTPKSTLSRQVRRLEKHLGVRLLERTTRRLAPTDVGEAYFARCQPALAEMEEAERVAADVSGRPAGHLRVSAPFDFARDRLATLLPGFHARYPDIDVTLVMTQRTVDLVAERFDVAFRGGEMKDSALISRLIAKVPIILCASPTYLDEAGRPNTPEDLVSHRAVCMAPDGRSMPWAMEGPDGEMTPLPLTPWLQANEWGLLTRALVDGLGVGMMLEWDATAAIDRGELERVLPGYALRAGGLYAIYPSRHHLTPKVRVFVDYIAEQLAAHRPG